MSQAGWYQDPAAPYQVRWWDGYRWTDQVAAWGVARPDPGPDRDEEAESGRLAAQALIAGAAAVAAQAFIAALLLGKVFRSFRDQLDAPLRSDGTRAPLVIPHGVAGYYAAAQVLGLLLLGVQILFLIWFYRAASVAARAGLPARRSPAWAIVGWIIPIVNLWFPYQSAADFFPPGHPARGRAGRWWALYLTQSYLIIPIGIAGFFSTGAALALASVDAALAVFSAQAARQLIAEVDRVHAGLLGR